MKNNIQDTIVAISSGNVNQAISIIRLSGEDSIEIVKKFLVVKSEKIRQLLTEISLII